MKHIRYFWYLVQHLFWVWVYGAHIGVSWRQLLIHDASKWSAVEWGPYVRFHDSKHGGATLSPSEQAAFNLAWEHHWQSNRHHWQYWLVNGEPLPMPDRDVLEMIADWKSANRVNGGKGVKAWYAENAPRIVLAENTRVWVGELVDRYG